MLGRGWAEGTSQVFGFCSFSQGTGWSVPHSPGPGGLPASALAAGQCSWELQAEEAEASEGDG